VRRSFSPADHREYKRTGAAFDRGETFAGADFKRGLKAVEGLRPLVPKWMKMTQFAQRWILMFDAVSCAIPGTKRADQVEENLKAASLPPPKKAEPPRSGSRRFPTCADAPIKGAATGSSLSALRCSGSRRLPACAPRLRWRAHP
jgi:hypothetical protein